jgi:hypothetical protein
MAVYWHSTVDGYFGRAPKERILEAVREGVSADAAKRIATMKEDAMAEAAAEMLTGKNWLPPLLRHAPLSASSHISGRDRRRAPGQSAPEKQAPRIGDHFWDRSGGELEACVAQSGRGSPRWR